MRRSEIDHMLEIAVARALGVGLPHLKTAARRRPARRPVAARRPVRRAA